MSTDATSAMPEKMYFMLDKPSFVLTTMQHDPVALMVRDETAQKIWAAERAIADAMYNDPKVNTEHLEATLVDSYSGIVDVLHTKKNGTKASATGLAQRFITNCRETVKDKGMDELAM